MIRVNDTVVRLDTPNRNPGRVVGLTYNNQIKVEWSDGITTRTRPDDVLKIRPSTQPRFSLIDWLEFHYYRWIS